MKASEITITASTPDYTEHPLVHDINREHKQSLSPVEQLCKRISDLIGSPLMLAMAVIIQALWLVVGSLTKWDPYPFPFLLTCSNILQLILIFVLAVGQRQASSHAERRAEHDHDAIARLLHHQEVQERILLALATKTQVDLAELTEIVSNLALVETLNDQQEDTPTQP